MAKHIYNQDGILRKLTWKRDELDARDKMFVAAPIALPPKVDLAPNYDLIFDQGQVGSCTGNSIAMHIDFTLIKEGNKPVIPSRLFIYYNERALENTIKSDAGAIIRDGIKGVATTGYCTEKKWPYIEKRFANKPNPVAYQDALQHVAKSYMRLNSRNLNDLKTCLAQGYGFVFGFSVFESFETDAVASNGIAPMPDVSNEQLLGGHAVFCLGYDDSTKTFKVRNSWGKGWGDKGHFYLPYDYMTNPQLANDFWTIRTC